MIAWAISGSSFVTQFALFVVSGSLTTLLGCVGLWAVARTMRAAVSAVSLRVKPRLLRRWMDFRTRKVPLIPTGAALAPAPVVRLIGVVEAEAVTPAAFSGVSTVVARHEIGERGGGSVHRSVAAQDFTIRLPDGHKVTVRAREALDEKRLALVDQTPDRWLGGQSTHGWFCESRLRPGDQVEVIGQAARAVDRHAERIGDRQPALSWILTAGRMPLALRFCTRPARS
ncbi:MAG TPA: hypothetical protein VGG33_00845 [Polyangia bacterium]